MKLVILDRDGVINYDSEHYIKSPAEWKPLPGSLEAIAKLTQAGYRVVVATNQSGIGRGLFDMDTLNAIHNKMHQAVQQFHDWKCKLVPSSFLPAERHALFGVGNALWQARGRG